VPRDDYDGFEPHWLAACMDGNILSDHELLEMQDHSAAMWDRAEEQGFAGAAMRDAIVALESFSDELWKRVVGEATGLTPGRQTPPLRPR
jgi:hypothetical protein